MNRALIGLLVAVSLSVITGNVIWAQSSENSPGMKMMTFEKGTVQVLNELGAIIVSEDSSLVVQMVMPAKDRAAEYKAADLQAQDKILMLNGKKIVAIKDLDDGYQKIDVGGDVKLAIKRGKDMMIVSFPKADPEKQSSSQTLVMRTQTDKPACQSKDIEKGAQVINLDGSNGELFPVLAAGIILTDDDQNVKIMALLPNAGKVYKNISVSEGDIIKSLQKKDITSSAQFSEIFEKIPVDNRVDLIIDRNGEEIAVSFDKKEPPMIMAK